MSAVAPERIAALRAQARADIPLVQRFEPTVRYAREMGWLLVRDPFTGEWHEVRMQDCPGSWRRAAADDKRARKLAQEGGAR